MHFSMICYFLNCSSRSHVVVLVISEEKKIMLTRGKKPLQTSCSGNGAYKIIDIVRISTSHTEWDAGGKFQGVSVCTSIRDTGLSPLSLNVLWERGLEKQEYSKRPTFSSLALGDCYQAATQITRDQACFSLQIPGRTQFLTIWVLGY